MIRNAKTLARIRALVIPPAWADVRIAPDPKSHIQAIGKDIEGRLQYRYHDDWTVVRDKVKAERLLRFGKALPKIRARIEKDLARRKTDRRYAAAVAGRLIDRALIRSGHSGSDEGGRGATTLLNRDVQLNGTKVYLNFTGQERQGDPEDDPRSDPAHSSAQPETVAEEAPLRLPRRRQPPLPADRQRSQRLSARGGGQAGDGEGFSHVRCDRAGARDALRRGTPGIARRRERGSSSAVMKDDRRALANTPAVTRSSYVHPLVVEAFADDAAGAFHAAGAGANGLDQAETALMRFLRRTSVRGKPRRANSGLRFLPVSRWCG